MIHRKDGEISHITLLLKLKVQCNFFKLKGALNPEQYYAGHLKYLSVENALFTVSPVVNNTVITY